MSLPPSRRVLFVDHTASMGGGEIALLNLVIHLRPEYHPVVLLFTEGPLTKRLRDAGIETHVLPLSDSVINVRKDSLGASSLMRLRDVWRTMRFILTLQRFIRRANVELVHTNSLKADIIGGIAARFAGVSVIWHVRDRIADDYLPRTVARFFRLLARVVPHRVIANSAATMGTLRLKDSHKTHTVPSGLPMESRFRVVHDGMRPPSLPDLVVDTGAGPMLIVGLVGRISPWKGQHIFLKAASLVRRRFPRARYQIIGSALFDEDGYEQEIRKLSTSLGLDDIVEFTGFRDDVIGTIAQLDLLVHASTTGEPFGQVILEGMAAGKPVVATRGGGVPEIVIDGVTGLLVPMGDEHAMADAIVRFLTDPEYRQLAGQRGRQRMHDYFTIEHTASKVQRVYDELLGVN